MTVWKDWLRSSECQLYASRRYVSEHIVTPHVSLNRHVQRESVVRDMYLFLESIKAKRRPVRDIEIGHRASAAALLGMVSWRAGRSIKWDGVRCVGDEVANTFLRRPYRAPWKYPEV